MEIEDQSLLDINVLGWPEAELALGYKHLTKYQSAAFPMVYRSSESLLISAPPCYGKTTLALLGVLSHVAQFESLAIFVTCSEPDFSVLAQLGISTGRLSGTLSEDLRVLENVSVAVATPSVWERVTRRWRARSVMQRIGLIVIDDIHLLEKIPTLELVASRLRLMISELAISCRILALGITVANIKDVASWLGISDTGVLNFELDMPPIQWHVFSQDYRPARILSMTRQVYQSLVQHNGGVVVVDDVFTGKILVEQILSLGGEDIFGDGLTLEHEDKNVAQAMARGIGLLDSSQIDSVVEEAYRNRQLRVVIDCRSIGMTLPTHHIVIMDTYTYRSSHYVPMPLLDLLHYVGSAKDAVSIFLEGSQRETLECHLSAPYPLESGIEASLMDMLIGEFVSRTITSHQDTLDWITWTYLYRRIPQNPNYYSIQGRTSDHINDYLSELVENTVEDLQKYGFLDDELQPTSLAVITDHYGLKYETAFTFSNSLTDSIGVTGLLEIFASASEFQQIAIRKGDEKILREIELDRELIRASYNTPRNKVLVLLYAHFSRVSLAPSFSSDLRWILNSSKNLSQALVDIIATTGNLSATLSAARIGQMLVQGLWYDSNPLLQLPHFNPELVEQFLAAGVEDLVDFANMENDVREKILQMDETQIRQIAQVCNDMPALNLEYEVVGNTLKVTLEQESEEDVPAVYAPRYPNEQQESWVVIIGSPGTNTVLGIKRIVVKTEVNLEFSLTTGNDVCIYLLCDSYIGQDQVETVNFSNN